MNAFIGRSAWPWHTAPPDWLDHDEAVWHWVRMTRSGEDPTQRVRRWMLEQGVRRSRDVLPPAPMTESDHERLRLDLIASWSDERLDPAMVAQPSARSHRS